MDTNIKPFELEDSRNELIKKFNFISLVNLKLSLYNDYFYKILSFKNQIINEAFLNEFLDDYLFSISKFNVWGINYEISEKIINQIKEMSSNQYFIEKQSLLNNEIIRIEKQFNKLLGILDGKEIGETIENKAYFPLIYKPYTEGFYGIIESITVRINKTSNENKFIIVLSEKEIEDKIFTQCKNSWELALNLSKNYVRKPNNFHEVIISFNKKEGFYEGYSLGIALSLSFLEQILKFYNSSYLISIKERTAFTGGITENGKVLSTSEEIIKQKIANVFYSELESFVFPKCEELFANYKISQLKVKFPNRNL